MQPIIITAFFTKNNIPISSLSPTVRIRKVSDGSLVITDELMTSVGDGQYAYSFSIGEAGETYTIVCDGSDLLSNSERYSYASIEIPLSEISVSFS